MPVWLNTDGLFIKTGRDEGFSLRGGSISVAGPLEVIEFDLNLTELTSTATILIDSLRIPRGARIERVEVVNETAATSGGAAVLDLGVVQEDRSTGAVPLGLVSGLALASINAPAGRVNNLTTGVTSAGSLVGTTLAAQGLITGRFTTAAFTAGRVVVRVFYYIP